MIYSYIKKYLKKSLVNTKAIRVASLCSPAGVVILRYHSILHVPEKLNDIIGCGIVHNATIFEKQMNALSELYVPVSMDEVHDFVVNNNTIPKRAVAVTFDDGFADNAEIAAPILNKYGIKGAFYITMGSVSPKPLPWFIRLRRAFHITNKNIWKSSIDGSIHKLDVPVLRRQAFLHASRYCAVLCNRKQQEWLDVVERMLDVEPFMDEPKLMINMEQIRRLRQEGHIVGSHTISHPNVAHIQEEDLVPELRNSKSALEEIIDEPVYHFSYPSPILQPHYNEKTTQIIKILGYRTAVTCTDGLVCRGDNPLCCRRVAVPEDMDEFLWKIESLFAGFGAR